MKKEIYIYTILFLLLSLLMHFPQWISTPLIHLSSLENSGAYGFGFIHPFLFTFLIYLLFFIPRIIIKFFKHRFTK